MRFLKMLFGVIAVVLVGLVGLVYLAPEKVLSFGISSDRKQAGLVRKEIDLPDGMHYAYLEGGSGEPLMFLHGLGANKDLCTKQSAYLTPHYHVIIPDIIGFGESSHPANADYTVSAQAERLRSFVHALGVDRLHLAGNSMGGQIALTYAALHPADVASLWLMDPSGVWSAPKSEYQKSAAKAGYNTLLIRNTDDLEHALKFIMAKPPFIPRPLLKVLARQRISNCELENKIAKQIEAESVEKLVTGMTIPALIVWGQNDRVLNPASADILHKLMPRSQVVIMPETGHVPLLEHPRESAEDYLRFRSSLK